MGFLDDSLHYYNRHDSRGILGTSLDSNRGNESRVFWAIPWAQIMTQNLLCFFPVTILEMPVTEAEKVAVLF